jgi:YfiH family protein
MHIHHTPTFSLFFTDKNNAFPKQAFYFCPSSQELLKQKPFEFLMNHGATELIVTDQTHGTNGLIVTSQEQAQTYKPYACQADFIVTNVPGVALGIATADCLPIIMYDHLNHVIAAIHAGWQGTVKGIAVKTVEAMQTHFGTKAADIQVFFGPSASVNVYEVGADFAEKIKLCVLNSKPLVVPSIHFAPQNTQDERSIGLSAVALAEAGNHTSKRITPLVSFDTKLLTQFHSGRAGNSIYQKTIEQTLIKKNGKHYFNVPLYNQLLLESIRVTQFNADYNECTITNQNYCSYRREKESPLRQMTVAILKNSL